jgi:DNA repair protein SbcC/Rad50
MRFKRLKLKNIRSYNEVELEFGEGSTLLAGDIGSGKTSILLGLQFAIFGLQPGQKGISLLKNGAEIAEAFLELEIGRKKVIIERKLKRGKNGSITQESGRITCDESVEEISTSEMKSRIISLLNYPKEFTKKSDLLYRFTVYTPQERMKEIIEERADIRLDLLRHIFGIERYKVIEENSNIFMQKLKESIKIKDSLSSDIFLLRERLVNEQERKIKKARENNDLFLEITSLERQKEDYDKILNESKKKLEERQQLISEISKNEAEMNGKIAMRDKVERDIRGLKNQLSSNIDFNQEELIKINALLEKHKNYKEELSKKFMDINSSISILLSNKEKALLMKEKVISLTNCPTCFQEVSAEHKGKISKNSGYELEGINIELEPRIAERQQIIKDIDREKDLIKGYESDKNRLEREKIISENMKSLDIKLKSELYSLERIINEIKSLREKTNDLKEKLDSLEKFSKEFEGQNKKIQEIVFLLKEKEIKFAENKREVDLLIERIDIDEREIARKEKIRKESSYLKELLEWIEKKFLNMISLTERNVLAKIRHDFSELFSKWFSMLVNDYLNVELDEDFSPIIYNKGCQMEYDSLSGGERTAIALAYRLSLNQIINSVFSEIKTKDIIILDEPTDGFSEEQLDKVRDILNQLNVKQTILVSHEQKIESFVDRVIKIKKDGESYIENSKTTDL